MLVLAEIHGGVRERNLDTAFVETHLDQPVEGPADLPLADRLGLDAALDHDGRIAEGVQSEHLHRLQDQRTAERNEIYVPGSQEALQLFNEAGPVFRPHSEH